jgi:hypothetical protein
MAGDWIKMRVDLRDDPAVFKLADRLGIDELHVVGCLYSFWAWCDKHAVDGHVDGATTRLIDKVSTVPGFADAMAEVGWLNVIENGIEIPHFERHNGESAKERGLKNARQARWRASKGANVDAAPSTSATTAATTREEKRREEKSNSSTDVEEKRSPRSRPAVRPEDVPESVWTDFQALRKTKRAPLTTTALDGIAREAAKASMSLADVLALCCTRGWQGFKADWVAKSTGKPAVAMPQALSFAERDELARRRRWEEMTGRKWPTENDPSVIDVTPSHLEIGQ